MYNILCKFVEIISISMIFIIHTMYKFFFSGEFKGARFYYNYFVIHFAIGMNFLLILPLFVFKGKHLQNIHKILGVYEYLGQRVLGIELTVRNSKVLAKDQAAIIVVNHQSSLEVILFTMIWRYILKKLILVSKKEFLYLFPYGPVHYLMGTMFVNRDKRGYADLDRIGEAMVKQKAKALIMPEGTRNHVQGTLLPFKRGAFYLAIKAQVPIIPMVISPFYFVDYDTPSFEKPRVTMQVLDEVPTEGLTLEDVPELTERVRLQIWEAYQKLYNECMDSKDKHDSEYDSNGFVIAE